MILLQHTRTAFHHNLEMKIGKKSELSMYQSDFETASQKSQVPQTEHPALETTRLYSVTLCGMAPMRWWLFAVLLLGINTAVSGKSWLAQNGRKFAAFFLIGSMGDRKDSWRMVIPYTI